MVIAGTYQPSPRDMVAEQVALFETSAGQEGALHKGKPIVVLWTRGRRSGLIRKSPVMRVRDGDCYAVVASVGGAPKHPQWYHNIVADPCVSLQDGSELRDYRARVATGEEKRAWWAVATAAWPSYDEYTTRTTRDIPLVILEPLV
jgi:deazaflavin-dependent oxidoreductase (nitroreductase family)